jgi:hypothetical protein
MVRSSHCAREWASNLFLNLKGLAICACSWDAGKLARQSSAKARTSDLSLPQQCQSVRKNQAVGTQSQGNLHVVALCADRFTCFAHAGVDVQMSALAQQQVIVQKDFSVSCCRAHVAHAISAVQMRLWLVVELVLTRVRMGTQAILRSLLTVQQIRPRPLTSLPSLHVTFSNGTIQGKRCVLHSCTVVQSGTLLLSSIASNSGCLAHTR